MKILRKLAVCAFIWWVIIIIWYGLQRLDIYPELFVEKDNIFRTIIGLTAIIIVGLMLYSVYKETKEFE